MMYSNHIGGDEFSPLTHIYGSIKSSYYEILDD